MTRHLCKYLLSALLAGAAGMAGAASEQSSWRFHVFLDERPIGEHHFVARDTDAGREIRIDAQFEVSWWILTAYQYRHDNVETWRGNCLHALVAQTDDDGKAHAVSGQDTGRRFQLEANGNTYQHELGCARTFAYWNLDALTSGPMLNAQTGELVNVTVERPVAENIQLNGETVTAERRRLHWEDGELTLWHATESGHWLSLEAPAPGGRTLRYVPIPGEHH